MLIGRTEDGSPGEPEYPLGQGAMFQIHIEDFGPVLSRLLSGDWPVYLGPRDVSRQVGNQQHGQREVFVQDPDGDLLMLAESLRTRLAWNEPGRHIRATLRLLKQS